MGATAPAAAADCPQRDSAEILGAAAAGVDWSGCDLSGVTITADGAYGDITMVGANLSRANLSDSTWFGAQFQHANFTDANLTNFRTADSVYGFGTNLSWATFDGANLSGAQIDAGIDCGAPAVLGVGIWGVPTSLPSGWTAEFGLFVATSFCPGEAEAPTAMWLQATPRNGPDDTCPDGWDESWHEWAQDVSGGWVCHRSVPAHGS